MIRLPRACRGRTAVRFPANISHMFCVVLALKGLPSAGGGFPRSLTDGYSMLMSPSKGRCRHCQLDMAVRMRVVMARPWVGVCVPFALIYW